MTLEFVKTNIHWIVIFSLVVILIVICAVYIPRAQNCDAQSAFNTFFGGLTSPTSLTAAKRPAAAAAPRAGARNANAARPPLAGARQKMQTAAEEETRSYHAGSNMDYDATDGMRAEESVILSPELQALVDVAAEGFMSKPIGGSSASFGAGRSGDQFVIDALTCTFPDVCKQVCNGTIPDAAKDQSMQYEGLCPCNLIQACESGKQYM
jgi:hypothetical protein